ncbi:MAG: M50 family metallopeptidase [Candidatus Melainabacteria bacterium]|nr:M50 family metallopeptidase [Candidatus Melainabacteria bacterium]
MQFPVVPLDLINLLFLPLMVITGLEVKKNWSSLWDQELTVHDRYLLQRIVIFWLIPAVVFFHELGHVVAIKLFGGQVKEFHYAFVWGYVVPTGMFTPVQLVWSYLAGNLVQIIIGLGALVGALQSRAPAAVALLVYLFFWSVGGTTIVYSLLSLTGLYGDWVAIYTQPEPFIVSIIAVCHAALALFVFWCLYGARPRQWFASRTNMNS